jgi:hypothetical protein
MPGKGQVAPENHRLIAVRGFSYKLVRQLKERVKPRGHLQNSIGKNVKPNIIRV